MLVEGKQDHEECDCQGDEALAESCSGGLDNSVPSAI